MGKPMARASCLAWPARSRGVASGRPFLLACLIALIPLNSSLAQTTLADKVGQQITNRKAKTPDRLLLEAGEMIYDRDNERLSARGSVKLYYQGRTLEADTVSYDRRTNRVTAQGHAKMTEKDGTTAYAERFELSDDFKNGFIDSLKADSADKTYFTSSRAERTNGETTVLENGIYTACEPCAEDPSKPPLWQIKAKRIIHQNSEQMIYYEDASLELYGTSIAYLPYLSVADPSVTRKSGLLMPTYSANLTRGVGVSAPLFWAIAPNYDLTFTPTFFTRQGPMLQAEWRHKLISGSYDIRLAGIFQQDPTVFRANPYGPGNRESRGSLETRGEFLINDKWKYGWDISLISDRWFFSDYRVTQQSVSSNYLKDSISTAYLIGKGDQGYFDLRGYYFKGLSSFDVQKQQPIVGPLLDYNKVVRLDPARSAGIGGQVELDFNFTNLSRQIAAFQSTGLRTLDNAWGLYDVCPPGANGLYTPANCLLRGLGGNYTRSTLNLSWKRSLIDPIGQVWTPFTFAHLNGSWLSLNQSRAQTFANADCGHVLCSSTISNASQQSFIGSQNDTFAGQTVPGIGIEYRFPLLSKSGGMAQTIEPIAQLVSRPGVKQSPALVNEDAQSLVFDESNLFAWSKYSGYDRFETGTRLNYGAQYTAQFNNGAYGNLMVGQSYHVAGTNSYQLPDAANIGLSSGLDRRRSDLITRAAFAPNMDFNFVTKARFDPSNYALRRLDFMSTARFGFYELGLQYARYQAQPLLGYDQRREGLSVSNKITVTPNTFVTGNVIFDLTRHLYNQQFNGHAPLFSVAGLGLGAGYTDDCIALLGNYTSIYQDNGSGSAPIRNQSLMLTLQLRTLGDTKIKSNVGDIRIDDGLSNSVVR
ncbi:MAG: LPS-assembly protein LptD [Alphaproteobacteria bacterium]|nr:LPS-assembly protein LptD [Alphaproteobacteria bacterium]